jgi:mannose-6-phosphate isomerase-like protein (cupin superfamily)
MKYGYVDNIEEKTGKNNHFRHVLYTAKHCQLVVMNLLPKEEIGVEKHDEVDQFFRIESGEAKIIMNGEESILVSGMVAIVPAGTTHNLINTGESNLKLYTLYSPPNHPINTIHHLKADALAAEKTEHKR